MKFLGWVLLVSGIILGLYALNMDVSVETLGGDRVNNIGLMNDRQNFLTVAGILSVIGVMLLIVQNLKRTNFPPKNTDRTRLKNLLSESSYVHKDSLDNSALQEMQGITERRKKLGFVNSNDNNPDFIYYYRDRAIVNNIIRELEILEAKSKPKENTGIADELIKLKGLFDNGALTQTEFEEQKRKLLQ